MINRENIQAKLIADIDIIVQGILQNMSQKPIAIYLCGGIGRDEGSWYMDNNGIVCPYNDYDVAVISEYDIEYEQLQDLRKELAKQINIHWVDIDFYSPKSLLSLKPTIHNVDLLEASKLIWGEDYICRVPKLDKRSIGEYDLDVLYRTRMWTLLGSWSGSFHDIQNDEARFFKNQMAKCVLAACDMILLKNHAYTTSYKDKAIIASKFSNDTTFEKLAKWPINEKLFPSNTSLSSEEMVSLYEAARSIFFKSFKYSMGEKANLYLDPDRTPELRRLNLKNVVVDIFGIFFKRYRRVKKEFEIFRAQNYAMHAYCKGAINNEYVLKASNIMKRWHYGAYSSWDELHEAVANARNNL